MTFRQTERRRVAAPALENLAASILHRAGVSVVDARRVAASLVRSDLLGHDSHGVRRLPAYLQQIRAGRIDPRARPEAEQVRPGAVVVHGRQAFGQLAAYRAVRELRRTTTSAGSAIATIRDCNHVGRLGEYVALLAEHDLIGIAFGNADPTVAPHGGAERRLGTNPLAWAVPRAEGAPPVVMDWATSGVAEGKLAVARDRGEGIREGLVLDRDGRATTDPRDFYTGGALLPFGGHKGYGLSVLIEIVGGLISGTGIGSMPGYRGGFGTVLAAFDIAAFQAPREFRERTEQFCAALHRTGTAEGHTEVLVPGEPEDRVRRERERDGIPLAESVWQELHALPRE
ncbi:Ldh family oxidoreductase [Amycolatopsis sp. 195334CR]|uniref:Ldh family oxidoreductase n=1 Tax=Amycolatopsis sp. 195334CR TaxID=2814588 RepID=UPI001A8F507E|nr:Ldh family oxidoreductase [Amycolatopsis sp. 195334CR]MBN6039531.1 Ldh family oxidoreductase [Amycolatopsis sp. 195334CR]